MHLILIDKWVSNTMIAALHEACVKLCTDQAGMLSGVVFTCGVSFQNLSIRERGSATYIVTYTWHMHNAYIKGMVSCTKIQHMNQSHGLRDPGRTFFLWLGCHNGKNLFSFPVGSPGMNSSYNSV